MRCRATCTHYPKRLGTKVQDLLQRTGCILTQRTKDKMYALHAPEVECMDTV